MTYFDSMAGLEFAVTFRTIISIARSGDDCPKCNGKLQSSHGIEVGHVFKLGVFYSEKMGASFLDQNGVSRPIIMGTYGIGLGRLLAAAVEQNHDDKGIIWPATIAPYHIYLCPLRLENPDVAKTAEKVYQNLTGKKLEVLLDDRDESPGVKFNDADLLGIPLRLTISPRTLESQSIEIKLRQEKQTELVPLEGINTRINELLRKLRKAKAALI